MKPGEDGIDRLLRRSMAGPVPGLPEDFDRRVLRGLHEGSKVGDRFGFILLAVYALMSALTCVVIMRGQGIDWWAIGTMILGPFALVATLVRAVGSARGARTRT